MQSDEYRRRYYGELPYPYHEDDQESDTHQEECSDCHGKGLVSIQPISIQTICQKCKGRGSIDWIDHMTGNPSPYEISRNLAMNTASANIEHLILLMKQIMAEVGENIIVSVDLDHRGTYGDARRHHTKWI